MFKSKIIRQKQCTICKKNLGIQNKSGLCQYHHIQKLQKEMTKQKHECRYCEGVMSDVTYNDSSDVFRCRRCQEELTLNQIQDKIIKIIENRR